MWFGCDVSKFFHKQSGLLSMDAFDYSLVFGCDLNLSKADRLYYGESSMTHAMVITGVNLDEMGNPTKWRIENSWGEDSGDKGYLCMDDTWFDHFTYQIVIPKRYLTDELQAVVADEPAALPAWVGLFRQCLIFQHFTLGSHGCVGLKPAERLNKCLIDGEASRRVCSGVRMMNDSSPSSNWKK